MCVSLTFSFTTKCFAKESRFGPFLKMSFPCLIKPQNSSPRNKKGQKKMLRGFLSRTEVAAGRLTSLTECRRYKSKSVRIANRLRVERFQAVRYTLPTRLDTAAPQIAAEWDFEKNPMNQYPQIVSAGSVHDAWWLCAACGCSFAMSPEKRVLRRLVSSCR